MKAVIASSENPGRRGIIGAPTFAMLRDTTQATIYELLEDLKIPYDLHASRNAIRFPQNGSEILFRSLEKPERLRGANIAWLGVDELTFCKWDSWMRLLARVRDPKARRPQIFASWTPNGFDSVYSELVCKSGTEGIDVIRAVPGENYHLPPTYYSDLKARYDPRFYSQEVLGLYLSLQSGTVYHAFDRERNIDSSIEYQYGSQLVLGCDYNLDPMAWVIGQILEYAPLSFLSTQHTKKLQIIDEVIIRDATIDLACSGVINKVAQFRRPGQRLQIHVYADASGQNRNHAGDSDFNLMKQYFARQPEYELIWHLDRSNPAIKDRVNAANAAFHNANGEVRVTVHPRCETLVKDFERVVWAEDSHGNKLDGLSKKDKNLSHASDAATYIIHKEFPANRMTSGGYKNDTRLI